MVHRCAGHQRLAAIATSQAMVEARRRRSHVGYSRHGFQAAAAIGAFGEVRPSREAVGARPSPCPCANQHKAGAAAP